MSILVEFGLVKFYNQKGYFFIKRVGLLDLFAHMKNQRRPVATEYGVSFEALTPAERDSGRFPQPEEEIAFEIGIGDRGPVANPWCYKKDYDAALAKHLAWPKPITYRVMVVYDQKHLVGGKVDDPKVEWGGDNGRPLEYLADAYPRNRYDPLRYYGGDDFSATRYIEMLVDGQWVKVDKDPRPQVADNYRRKWSS